MTFDQMIRETLLEMLRYDSDVKKQMICMIKDVLTTDPEFQGAIGTTVNEMVAIEIEKMATESDWVSAKVVTDAVESAMQEYDFTSVVNDLSLTDSDEVERMIDRAFDNLSVEISR